MRERVCRFCNWGYQSRAERKPFVISGATPHYAPDRPFRLEHILLNLKVDPKNKTLSGVVTQKVRVVSSHQKILKLDQIGLSFEDVTVNHHRADFTVEGKSLLIFLNPEFGPGELFEVTVRYSAPSPKRGVYFTGPDQDYPQKPHQVWTQGQDEDSQNWFPTLDYPNQKATSEVIVIVPSGFVAVSNGALLSQEVVVDGTRFHYRLGIPHVTYLMSLVVAEFAEWSEKGPRGLPIQYFVAKGRESDGKRAFQNTPRMISAFETKTGVSYPYEKYSQAAVQDFIFGGMENTSATTQTDLTLHDERAHLDFSSDPLVSHELAHQWFGDLVTCRDWSHGWLNEGFATFMERVWVESDSSANGGFEEAKYYSYQDLKEYLADDSSRYRRPIICNTYIEPIDLFDTHLYQKGGLILNLIRHLLGEESFWKAIQVYLERHREGSVETIDLLRAIEDTTGRNLRQFSDEWLDSAGHPEFEVSFQWHRDRGLAEWVIEQKQTNGAEWVVREGVTTRLFHLPVCLEITFAEGQKQSHVVQVGAVRERVFVSCSQEPKMVRFDPNGWIPKTLKFPRHEELLLYQLQHDPDCLGRIEAVGELVKVANSKVVAALAETVLKDTFWGVQVEAAKGLASLRTDDARDGLIAALAVSHPKARRAIASALENYRDPKVTQAIQPLAVSDPSYFVEAAATRTWTLTQLRPTVQFSRSAEGADLEAIELFLRNQLKKYSYRDVIQAAALDSLAELPGVSAGERPKTLEFVIHWTRRGLNADIRGAAIGALGKLLKVARLPEKRQILEVFDQLADEGGFRVRTQLIAAMAHASCLESLPILARIRQSDSDGRVTRAAQVTIDTLMLAGSIPESLSQFKLALEKVEEDYRKLHSKLEELRPPVRTELSH